MKKIKLILEESLLHENKKSLKGVFNDDLIKLEQLINNSGFVLELGAGLEDIFKVFAMTSKDKAILNNLIYKLMKLIFLSRVAVWDF